MNIRVLWLNPLGLVFCLKLTGTINMGNSGNWRFLIEFNHVENGSWQTQFFFSTRKLNTYYIVPKNSHTSPHRALCFRPPPPGILVIFQLGLRRPEKKFSVKIAVALYYFVKDNSFFDKERKILSLMSVMCLIIFKSFLVNN